MTKKTSRRAAAVKGWETRRRNARHNVAVKGWKTRRRNERAEARRRHASAVKGWETRRRNVAESEKKRAETATKRRIARARKERPPEREPEIPLEPGIERVSEHIRKFDGVIYTYYTGYEEFFGLVGAETTYRKSFADHQQAARWIKEIGVNGVFTVVYNEKYDIYNIWEIPS